MNARVSYRAGCMPGTISAYQHSCLLGGGGGGVNKTVIWDYGVSPISWECVGCGAKQVKKFHCQLYLYFRQLNPGANRYNDNPGEAVVEKLQKRALRGSSSLPITHTALS